MIGHDDIIGITGTITLILAYTFTTYPNYFKISQNLIFIDILNVYGSAAVGYNCIYKQTYPPLVLEVVWFILGSISLIKQCTKKQQPLLFTPPNKLVDISQNKFITNNQFYHTI